jgi:hypothetical protein
VVIPPFASRVGSTSLTRPCSRPPSSVFTTGVGTLRTRLLASSLGAGLLVGSAGRMTVQVPSNINSRSVFVLGL